MNGNGAPILCSKNKRSNMRLHVWRLAHPNTQMLPGRVIYPRCGNKLCLNPEHLVQTSWSELNKKSAKRTNQALRQQKNIIARQQNGKLKLNWEIADLIRASSEDRQILADRYGVDKEHIRRIQKCEVWVPRLTSTLMGAGITSL